MSYFITFLIGIGSSIVAAIIFRLLCHISFTVNILSKCLPKAKGSISGQWISNYEEAGKEYTERISLYQLGKFIRGVAKISEPGEAEEIQKFKGVYKNQILTAEYWSTEKDVIERGTFTLQRKQAKEMSGFYIYFLGETLQPAQREYVWKRPRKR